MLPPRDTAMIPLNWKFKNTAWPCWFLLLLYQQAKKKVTYWQSDWSWLPRGSHFAATQQGSKDNTHGTPVFFQMPPGISICNSKRFWKTITTKKSLTIRDSDTLRMKIWSHHQVKDLGKLKYYLRKENMTCLVGKRSSYNTNTALWN